MGLVDGPVNEAISGIFGSVSLTSSVCLLIPQLIKNFRSRNADGLSLTFLAIWLLGDLSSLCGGIITGIAPSAIVLSAYLCCSDSILLAQTLYYRSVRRAELRNKDQENPADYTDERSALLGNDSSTTPASQGRQPEGANTNSSQQASPSGSIVLYDLVALVGVWVVGILGYFVTHAPKFGVSPFLTTTSWEPSPELKVFGEMLGYLGALCYLSARIPQIVKNHKETSTEGLAILFFMFSITGNFTYGMSVLVYSQDRSYLLNAIPWLLGSLGTMVEDSIIFYQFKIYSRPVEDDAELAV